MRCGFFMGSMVLMLTKFQSIVNYILYFVCHISTTYSVSPIPIVSWTHYHAFGVGIYLNAV